MSIDLEEQIFSFIKKSHGIPLASLELEFQKKGFNLSEIQEAIKLLVESSIIVFYGLSAYLESHQNILLLLQVHPDMNFQEILSLCKDSQKAAEFFANLWECFEHKPPK